MAGISKNSFKGRTEYTLCYSEMRGVDFSATAESGRQRYSYLENMYRDYDGSGGALIESVPGFRKLIAFGDKINGIYHQRGADGENYLITHVAGTLYRSTLSENHDLTDTIALIELKNNKSTAFSHGYDLYVLDGEKMIKVSKSGEAYNVGEEGALPYVPTTYKNGVAYEQRNLLTDSFKESVLLTSTDLFTYGSHELLYRITDADNRLCAAVGLDESFEYGGLEIPSYVDIGGESFRVNEIADDAFSENTNISSVKINEGVIRVGKRAFADCKSLNTVYCPNTLTEISDEAFSGCITLEQIYLGSGTERLGELALDGCDRLVSVFYPLGTESFEGVDNVAELPAALVITGTADRHILVEIPLYTPTEKIVTVTVDGEEYPYTPVSHGEGIASVLMSATDGRIFEGKEIIVSATARAAEYSVGQERPDLLSSSDYSGTGLEAIMKCTVCENFDGRVFLSGNPSLPNTVIYSARDFTGNNNPLYYGTLNYFNDGVGNYPVVSLLAAGDSLAVFKSGDDGCGSIFYHTPTDVDSHLLPRIYPVSYVHSGISALGASISFFDDPVFISRNGVSALDKKTISLERSIACRSHNVNPRLLSEKLSEAMLAKWCGYLAVCVGGNMYLADSRATFLHSTGSYEYEWYYLTGIGTRKNATRVFRYASIASDGYSVHPTPEEKVVLTVKSIRENNTMIYFTEEGDSKYAVYATMEMSGGDFSPAAALLSIDDELLIFGTESGDVCIFNNDKRGVAPAIISEKSDFDAEEYKIKYSQKIHPYFYSADDQAQRYALRTVSDNCGIPHLTKSTVKHSLTLKCRAEGNARLLCEIGTDRSGYSEIAEFSNMEIDFADINFAHMVFEVSDHSTVPLSEKEKGWIEKEIALSSGEMCSPIGIYSLAYRFTVKGRIKKN